MTVVVYKDGVLASDSGVTDNMTHVGTVTKLFTHGEGKNDRPRVRYGFAGPCMAIMPIKKWIAAPPVQDFNPPDILKEESVEMIVVENGPNSFLDNPLYCDHGYFYDITAAYYAIGAGRFIAMGAMEAGASAVKAVEIVCKLHQGCSMPIQFIGPHDTEVQYLNK
jgi:hypothetical protein